MVCGMKEYLKQSLEVWGHLNWTLFPLREALGLRSINACSFMSTSLWTASGGILLVSVPAHACDTLMSAVLVAYETGCSTLLPGVECCPLCMDPILELRIPSWAGG